MEVEYHNSAVSYFERMRQLESRSVRIVADFDPISFLLTSDEYDNWLSRMLEESIPASLVDASWEHTIRRILGILLERKKVFARTRPDVTSLIGLRQIEQFLSDF